MASCLAFLAMFPEHQKKVYDELFEIFGDSDRDPTLDDLKKMVYLEMCLKEALRHCAPAAITRRLSSDIQIGWTTIIHLKFSVINNRPIGIAVADKRPGIQLLLRSRGSVNLVTLRYRLESRNAHGECEILYGEDLDTTVYEAASKGVPSRSPWVEFTIYRVLEDDDRHLIPIGHRGSGSDEYRRNNHLPYIPENTLVSYEKAYKSGSSWVELDLMISSDNKIVVTHNFKIDNTPVWNMTYDQFKARTSSPILFEELFWKLDAKINLDLDIKYPSIDEIEEQNLGTPPNLEHYMDLILDTIRRRKNRDLILSSFEPDAVAYLKRTAPDLNVFFLTEALPDKFTDSRRNSFANGIRFCIENDLQGIGTDSEVISANPVNEVAMVHGAGLQLVVYFWRANFRKTNYVDEIIKFECAGVDGVITDDIPMVRRIIGNTKNSHSSVEVSRGGWTTPRRRLKKDKTWSLRYFALRATLNRKMANFRFVQLSTLFGPMMMGKVSRKVMNICYWIMGRRLAVTQFASNITEGMKF
ncbi:unnamed protein product, partial [Nesidiocoris tenuis]